MLFLTYKIGICLYFDLSEGETLLLCGFNSHPSGKKAQCHPSFLKENFQILDSKTARKSGLFWQCHTFCMAIMAQWVGFEPTSLKGHHDFEQIINLPNWSLIVLKIRRFPLILSTFLREFGNLREKCEKTARNFSRLKLKMKGKSDHE